MLHKASAVHREVIQVREDVNAVRDEIQVCTDSYLSSSLHDTDR